MAGKRNINRLRKAIKKQDLSGTIEKAAQATKRVAQSASTSSAVKRGANTAKNIAYSAGRRYSNSSNDTNHPNYMSNSKLNTNKEKKKGNKDKAETTTTKAVMEKYKTLTASSGTAATALIGKDTRNKIDKSKKEAEKGQSDVFKWAGGTIKNIIGSQIAGLPDNVENLARTSRYTGTHGLGNVLLDTSTTAARKLTGKKSEKKERPKDPVAKKMETLGGKLLDEGQSDIEKVKEGKSEAAKWGINLATLGAQFATDALITKGIKVPSLSIYNRSYGIAKQDALKDGANEEQAKKKAELSGAIEVATEGLGNAAKPLKAVFGKGVTDDIMETLLNKVVSKTSSKAGKNIVYHGGKTIISAISEGLEEMVSEGLDPIVANKIYAESIGRPHDMTSLKEYAYVGSLGAAMGGILGGGGQIVEYSQGRKVQNVFGADGVKKLAKAASQVDDAAESVKGAALNEMINRGDGIAAGQANELYKAVYGQEIKDLERNDLVDRSADAIMQRENLISPIQIDEETGATIVGRNTAQVFNEQKGVATATVNQLAAETNLQLPEMSSEQISSAVAAIQTGIGGIDEVNLFTVGNPEARTVYEAVTGKTLPETNQETREMLFEEIGKNRINSARLETEKTVDAVRGLVAQDVAQYYEATGQEAFAQAFSNVNIGDAAQVGDSLNTFDDFYRAGRNGIAYADVISVANPTHQNISSDIKRAAWQAGQQDAFIAADTARGVQMRIGETARQARLQRRLGGRLYSDISRENRSRFTASQQGMYRMLARTFGIDIHVVDSLESGANGEYHDGVIYLSMSSDRALEYVFAHEITHHMQDYAPEEYNQLKEFVRAKWGQQGGIDDAVDLKVSQYAVKDVELSREQALDEIIADSTYEMLQDEGFVDELCKTHRGVAQAILDAIKGVLRKLRAVIADGDRFTPAQNEALLSELDILKEFEKMWTDGLMRAAENRAAVGSVGAEVRQQARQRVQPFDITRSEILGNMKKVTEMSPVATLDGSGFEKQEGRPLSQAVMDYYGGEEFYVNNPTLGEVRVGKRGIKSSVQHRPLYGTKIEGFKALKEIISDGVVINASRNYAGKRNDRICVAAPIRIGDDIYYAGVIINRNADEGMQNYYLHDVITIEKNSLSLKDTEAQYESARMDETVSPYTILQQLNNINNLSEKDVISDEGRFSFKEDTSITYDSLVSKPDMKIVNMDEYHIRDGRKGIVDDARKAIKATGKVDNGQHIIHNEDVDRDIIVGRKALLHGLNRHYESNAQVTVHINEYLKNAVKINELAPRGGNINESYILFGYGRVGEDSYPAYFVVNTYENGNTELDDFDVLYSANAKKIEGSALSSQGFNTSLPSTISISDLLDIVNEMYSDILPQSVADHYGNERRNTKLGESVKFSLPDESDAIDYANEHGTENFGVKFSLKNENITPNTKIPYVNHSSYMEVNKNDNKALRKLQDKVRALKRGTYENKATGYKADINSKTIGKLIRPTNNKFNAWGEKFNYIENLNAAVYLPELFYNAVYVDTKQPQKKKNEGKQIQGYHHFVAPIYMDNRAYRVMITAREKQNSDALYVVKTEVIKIKEGTQLLGQKPRNSVGMPSDISIPELIDGVKIYDYDMQKNDVYTQENIRFSLKDYDDAQVKNWERSKNIIIYENPQQLKNFVDEARKGKASSKKIYFGVVPDDLAERVLNETGIDISNRNVALGAYEVQKILKDHGDEDKESTRGQRAVTADDFSNIRDVIESPDTIELDGKLYNGRPIIKFTKVIGSKNTVVTYDSARSSDLRVQTMYIGQNKKSLATVIDEQASINTPEATSGTALNSSIPDAGSKGNTQYSLPDESDVIDYVNEPTTENFDVKFSLKNENITPDTKIPYVNHSSYMEVKKNDNKALRKLQDKVKGLKRGTYENKATGYKADINAKTLNKIINPTHSPKFSPWVGNYIENLNAAIYLPELFENAVYLDTKEPQKLKNEGKQIKGYHHFIAPIYMNGREYRVRIVAREKQNSDVLYIVDTELFPMKNGAAVPNNQNGNSYATPLDISIPELINGVKIYDYDMQINDVYTQKDIKYSLPDESDVIDYVNEHEIEFVNVTGFRDYEVKQKAVRQQTYGELKAQVEKLERDKRFTKGKVLDEKSVREQVNSLVVTLMTHSESYTPNGGRRKTNYKLVRDGVHAVSKIYTAMKDGDILAAINAAEIAADDIVQNLELVNDAAFYEYKKLRDYLRTTRLVISEEDTANIPDFKQFKNNNFGRIRLVQSNGVPIEAAHQELLEMYPELFSEGITHPAGQLLEMAEVRESLEPYDIMLAAEETEQLIKQTAQDLIDIAALGKPYRSWADKMQDQYDEKLKIVKARHKEALRDVKKNERERTERILKGERQKWAERVNRANERGNKKVQEERERAREREAKRKDRELRKAYMTSIEQSRRWLSDRLARPTDDKHIPEGFKAAAADILSQMDMQSQKSKKLEKKSGVRAKRWVAMDELRARFAEIAKEDGSGEFEYDGYIFEVMNSLAEHMNGRAIDEASTEQLKEFDVLMKYIVTNIRNYNKAFDENIKEGISQLGGETISKSKARQKKLKGGKYYDRSGGVGMMDRLLNESMVTPRDFFERIGGGMEKVFMSMRRGMDRHVDNLTKTRDFFDDIFKPYRNKTAIRKRAKPGSIIEKWRDDTHLKEFSVQGGKIKLNPAQIMSLYCLSKRKQALGHILGSGVVASRVDKASRIKKALGAKIETGGSTVMISLEDIVNITQSLTEEQKEMADKLQDYLNNECAEWGNEVSMKIYGYRKFTENNYFPIKSADAYLDSNFEGRQEMERIKNFGFTKGTVVNANNPIMIDDIFKTVADHINKMSLYNAFAAPISDFTRVYNYKNRNENGFIDGSVKDALEDAYGKKAINYINNFMADVNNQVQMRTEGIARFVSKSLANYKKSAIGGNLRVALQQPTAVARAFMYINPRYFLNGNVNIVKNLNDMKEHCQIARWKAWGHSQVDMARDIDDVMMNNEWSKIDAVTMEIYGALDNITWSTIWSAVRAETKHKHKDVKVNSEEFYRICNERASEIFDKTQVVDSVFHRSQVMRNTDTMSKMVTSFMAEPTRTFNMMRTQYAEAAELWQEGNKVAAISKMNKATSVFLINAAAVSAAAAVADTLRGRAPDDDDDDSWLKNFFANFWGNVNPLNMIPVVKDIWGYTDGWGTSNMAMEGWEKLVQSAMNLAQNRDAESFKTFAEGLGYVTGLPVKNVIREADSIFKAFGIDVFAAEESDGEKKEKSIFEKIWGTLFGKFSKSKSSDGEQEHDKSDTEYYGIYADRRKGVWDKLTNKTEGERKRESFDKRVSEIKKNVDGLTGSEKEKAIWESVTKNYTVYIADGELGTIKEMRRTLEAAGGDVEKFDKSVQSEVKTAMRKNIGGDGLELQEYRAFLNEEYGLSDAKINQEVLMRSEAAKNFQVAACTDDTSSMVTAIVNLYAAGITDGELDVLYINRTKAIKGSDYSTGELAYPVNGAITSAFGYRDQPTAGASTYHEGIDIGAPAGSDVAAADGGRVSKVGWNGGKGYSVTIDHGNGRYTEYNHLEGYYVRKGDAVSKGQIIALVGSTGVSTGPHLDFRVRENGTYIDPIIYFR